MKKVAFHTLGCKLNYAETSTLAQTFAKQKYRHVNIDDKPDIFIINTCSVTENADKKCHKLVREVKTISPNAYVAVVGCYAQLKPNKIAKIPGVNAVLGTNEKFKLQSLLNGFAAHPTPVVHTSPITGEEPFNASQSGNNRTRTLLKIQDGCDYNCSFCTIPLARGKSRSGSISNLVSAAKKIATTGVKEIVLTGVNIGDFGQSYGMRKEHLIDLLKALDTVEGIERFRISSIEPNLITYPIIEFVARSKRFVPHFHIPLQSGSDHILRLMRRRYPSKLYQRKVEKIKQCIPHCSIGVDVIVGFPGEGQTEFRETHTLLDELDISYMHVFPYSERNNTVAVNLPNAVTTSVRHQRSKILRLLSNKKRRAFYQAHVGRTMKVLFEGDIKNGRIHGFTENYIRTSVAHNPLLINTIKQVRLHAVDEHGIMHANPVEVPD